MQQDALSGGQASQPMAGPGPLERIDRIAEVIEKSSAVNERLGQLTPEVVGKLNAERLFRLLLPRAYGGEEVDLLTWFRAMEKLASLDGSTAWCVGQINGCAASAATLSPDIARKIWSDPSAVLSWGPAAKARADEVDGGHRLTGEWMFSSGSRHATWLGLAAQIHDRSGTAVPVPKGLRTFLVPVGSVELIENWNVVGLKATNSGGFKVSGLFVPQGYSVYREDLSEVQVPGPLYKFPLNSCFAVGFSAVALGIARAMLDAIMALAKDKRPRLAKVSLLENHHVHFQIGEAEARLRSARGFVEATAERVWCEVVASGVLTIEQRVDIRMATTFAIHEAVAVADVAWQVAGASAIFASSPFERRFRDIRTVMQQVQGRKAHLQDVGAYLLGLDPYLAYT